MRHLRNKNLLLALSWLAIFLAATTSADVVEDLVFEPFEAEAAESSLPQQDLEDPAENATVRSVGASVPNLKMIVYAPVFAGLADGLMPFPSRFVFVQFIAANSNHTPPASSARFLTPLRI